MFFCLLGGAAGSIRRGGDGGRVLVRFELFVAHRLISLHHVNNNNNNLPDKDLAASSASI